MLVDNCNLAQLTAWAYREMYFNCVALQSVHYFLNMKTYFVALPKCFWHLLLLIFNILLKYFKNLPLDLIAICRYCKFLDIYILEVVYRHNRCSVPATE